jgi:hypothetical protein
VEFYKSSGVLIMDQSTAIQSIAVAIAFAEGFYVPGSRASRNHNPGDLTVDTVGLGVGQDGPFVIYATDNDGWTALKKQVELILTNASHVYTSDMTINQIAALYTSTDSAAWAMNVASKLGVSPDTRISDIMNLSENVVTAGVGLGALILAVVALWYLRKKP